MSNCIYVDEGDPALFHRAELRRARKPHECCECREEIRPGDLYEYAVGKWEDEWSTFKTCARCVNVRTDYFRGWMYTMMVEDFEAAHGFDYRDGIPADLTPCGATS